MMARFFAVILVALAAGTGNAQAQPILVQSNWLQAIQVDQATLALTSPPTPGNVLIAICGTAVAQTLDSISPGWLIAIDESANGPGLAMLYKVADSTDTAGLTIRYAMATRLGMQLYEYTGIDPVNPLQAVVSSSGSDTLPTTASVTTLQPDELLVAGLIVLTDDPVTGWTGGFVEHHNFVTSQPPRAPSTHAGADLVAASVGSYATSTVIGGRKARWRMQLAAFSPAAPISVLVSNGTFAFGTQPANLWLPPQSTLVINDGEVVENFLCRVSPFTDGANVWAVDPATNGPDQIQAQWSTTGATGPWIDLAAYGVDFNLATAVPAGDTVNFWFRIRTPSTTSSYNTHAAGVTITAEAY